MTSDSYRFPDYEILRPINDVAFKALFSRSEHLIKDLLQCSLHFLVPIESVTYLNTELSPDLDGAKSCRLDVAVQLSDGTLVDVEIQTRRDLAIRRRSVAYASKLLSSQIEAGKDGVQPDVIALMLLNHQLFPEYPEIWRRSFELRDQEGRFLEERVFRIDFVELLKAKRLHTKGDSLFSKWIDFFTAESFEELKALCERDQVLRQAQERLEMVSRDKQIWSDARAKWEGEFAIRQEMLIAKRDAKAEGLAEGIDKGINKGLAEAANGMLEAGATREFICKALKLTDEKLTALLATPISK